MSPATDNEHMKTALNIFFNEEIEFDSLLKLI